MIRFSCLDSAVTMLGPWFMSLGPWLAFQHCRGCPGEVVLTQGSRGEVGGRAWNSLGLAACSNTPKVAEITMWLTHWTKVLLVTLFSWKTLQHSFFFFFCNNLFWWGRVGLKARWHHKVSVGLPANKCVMITWPDEPIRAFDLPYLLIPPNKTGGGRASF